MWITYSKSYNSSTSEWKKSRSCTLKYILIFFEESGSFDCSFSSRFFWDLYIWISVRIFRISFLIIVRIFLLSDNIILVIEIDKSLFFISDIHCSSISMMIDICIFNFETDISFSIREYQSFWNIFESRRFDCFYRENDSKFCINNNYNLRLSVIDSIKILRDRSFLKVDTLRVASNIEITEKIEKLTSSIDSDNPVFDTIEIFLIDNWVLTSFFAASISATLDFDNSVSNLIDNLISISFSFIFVDTWLTVEVSIFVENCSLFDKINCEFCKWRTIFLIFPSNLLTADRSVGLLIIQSTDHEKVSTDIDYNRAWISLIEIFSY